MKLNYKLSGRSFLVTSGLMMFFLSTVVSQNAIDQKLATANENATLTKIKSADWQLLYSNESVAINYRNAKCELTNTGMSNEYFYLQIKNKTTEKIKLEWNTEYWYNNKCNGCDGVDPENHKTITLKPNETLEGTCSEKSDQSLQIFIKMLNLENKSELTNFNLRDIKATMLAK